MANALRRNSYTFKESLTMMAVKALGIDPDLAAEAGDGARAAINAIRHAAKAKSAKDRAALIRTAQSELRSSTLGIAWVFASVPQVRTFYPKLRSVPKVSGCPALSACRRRRGRFCFCKTAHPRTPRRCRPGRRARWPLKSASR
jgi:hypothetical protein